MAIRDILRMGDPRLLQRALPVEEFDTPGLHALVADLFDTMHSAGGVGLAAPQLGVGLRVVVFGFAASARYPHAPPVPPTVLVNPVLTPLGTEEESGWEGCLSLPGLRGEVTRHVRLRYEGLDAAGRSIRREVDGFHARVVQHECDHLDGLLYPQRMHDMSRFGFVAELFPELAAAS